MLEGQYKTLTETGLVVSGAGYLLGILVGADGVNDPEITVHDNTAASGEEIIPTTTVDAEALGFNGFFVGNTPIRFENGLYLTVSAAGSKEVTFYYTRYSGAVSFRYL